MDSTDEADKPITETPEPKPEQVNSEATEEPVEALSQTTPAVATDVVPEASPEIESKPETTNNDPLPAQIKAKKSERPSPKVRKNQPTLQYVTARFAGCGRCSYFWAGYRVLHGVTAMETAVAESKSGWLQLAWDSKMPDLIYKTFGVRLDISHFHYEGCCKECCRHFIYRVAEDEGEENNTFRIEISPKTTI